MNEVFVEFVPWIINKSLPIRYHQPNLGEQSKEILEELGYTKNEIDNILNLKE